MTAPFLRRGACPSLSEPMQTGDGLLVRLNPRDGLLSPDALAGIAQAAARFGNGILEITARGNLQIRGLSLDTAPLFALAIAELGIEAEQGVEVRTGALAGVDATELADPRPLADAVRRGIEAAELTHKLAPKVSVTVDGGGALPLAGLIADVKLEACIRDGSPAWSVRAGSSLLGWGNAEQAVARALAILELLAQRGQTARAKDFSPADLAALATGLVPTGVQAPFALEHLPVGRFALKTGGMAQGFALAFGQAEAERLIDLCRTLDRSAQLRLAAGRGLLVVGGGANVRKAMTCAGFVVRPDDIRLRIAACAGMPGCASAWIDTKRLAARAALETAVFEAVPALHLSGCSKGCAKPAGPHVSLIGGEHGSTVVPSGVSVGPRLEASLKALAEVMPAGTRVPA